MARHPTCVAEIGTRDDTCPYCGVPVGRAPRRASVCAACRQKYRVRNRKREDGRRLLTEMEALFLDVFWSGDLVPQTPGTLWADWEAQATGEVNGLWSEMSAQFGKSAGVGDILWRIYGTRAVRRDPDAHVGYARFRMGQVAAIEGRYDLATRMLLEALYCNVVDGFLANQTLQEMGLKPVMEIGRWLDGKVAFPSSWIGYLLETLPHLDLAKLDLRARYDEATAHWNGHPDAFPPAEAWRFIHWEVQKLSF